MPELNVFKITRRHYDIIAGQAKANFPQESGGFFGGRDNTIQAILPVSNQYLFNRTDTFMMTSDDCLRAHAFFKKHKLEYYGFYHSHPQGVPYPSLQDVNTKQHYHLIIGLKEPDKPVMAMYEIMGTTVIPIQLELMESAYDVKDIHAEDSEDAAEIVQDTRIGQAGSAEQIDQTQGASQSVILDTEKGPAAFILPDIETPMTPEEEASYLGGLIQDIKDERAKYPKMPPKSPGDSDFSTLA
ncbi:Mov34/MPN/PAD-1 family protein [Thermoproteota archaeon]